MSTNVEKKTDAGAIWHGPWHTGLIHGTFGSPANQHWAMAIGKNTIRFHGDMCAFFPFTSKKKSQALLTLRPGTAPFGNSAKTSYLVCIRLIVKKSDLNKRFRYTCTLSKELYAQAIHEYKIRLSNRKKAKGSKQ